MTFSKPMCCILYARNDPENLYFATDTMKTLFHSLLRKSETLFQTDMSYIVKGGFWLTLGQIVSSASSFLLVLLFANYAPKETYGIYKYILTIASILALPSLMGINTALTQAVARGYEGTIKPALRTRIAWGTLGSLGGILLAGYYYVIQADVILAGCLLIVALFSPFFDSLTAYESILTGRKDFKTLTNYFLVMQLFSVAVMAATIFFTTNVFLIILSYFLPWTIGRTIALLITLHKQKPNDAMDPGTIPYGKHLSLMGVIGTISGFADRLLVFHFLGAVEMAVYSIALAGPDNISAVLKGANTLALPKFSESKSSDIKKSVFIKTLYFSGVVALVVGLYILAAPFLFALLFPKYMDAVLYSQVFAISLIATSSIIPYSALQAKKAQKELYFINTWVSLFTIVLLFVFMYLGGLMGLVIARVVNRFISLTSALLLVKRMPDEQAS